MLLFEIFIATILFICGFISHTSQKNLRLATNNIPGPFSLPLLGCLHIAASLRPENVLKLGDELLQKHGKVIKGWVFNQVYILSADDEFNEQILSSPLNISKMKVYDLLKPWLGNGLLISDGRKWHARRKVLTPAFHFKILEEFLEIFERQSTILIDCLAEQADDKTHFNILPYIEQAALDIVMETAMGIRINGKTKKNMQVTRALHEITALMTWRGIRLHLYNEYVFSLLYPHKKLRQTQLVRILHAFTRKVIVERRKLLENTMNSKPIVNLETEDDIGRKKRMVFLDVLLQATIDGKALSNEDILEEVNTFMFGGIDTVSSTLSFVMYLLARHPRVQNKVLAEICRVYGEKSDTPLTLMNLNELKYMECVIKETLRLYPSVPFIGREITEDFKYVHSQLGDGVLPAGSNVIIAIYSSLKNPLVFENPLEFIPERHETIDFNTAFSYIPFSAGPRNCIGQKYAMFEMKVIIMKILRAYELLPLGPEVKPIVSIVIGSATGMQLGLRKRST